MSNVGVPGQRWPGQTSFSCGKAFSPYLQAARHSVWLLSLPLEISGQNSVPRSARSCSSSGLSKRRTRRSRSFTHPIFFCSSDKVRPVFVQFLCRKMPRSRKRRPGRCPLPQLRRPQWRNPSRTTQSSSSSWLEWAPSCTEEAKPCEGLCPMHLHLCRRNWSMS